MKPEEIIRALILLETKTIDLAPLFAHEFWPDHKAWEGADQRARENVYQRAFTVLSHLMYKRLILPTRPYTLTDAGHAHLFVHREQARLLRLKMYEYDQLSDWYDGPVIYLKILHWDDCETGALYILAERGEGLETFLIASLDHVQGKALMMKESDMHTLIKESTRRYLITYHYSPNEQRKAIKHFTGDVTVYLPAPGEYFKGNPDRINKHE